MKKFLLSLATIFVAAASAFATTEVLQVNSASFWGVTEPKSGAGTYLVSASNPDYSITQGAVTITTHKGDAGTASCVWNTNDAFTFRSYNKSTLDLEATSPITQIVINGVKGKLPVSAEGSIAGETTVTWAGSASKVTFSFTGTAQIHTIEVTYGGEAPKVLPVSFTPPAGTYEDTQSVALACATEGATIYYQTSGDWGDAQVYSAPIIVDESKTIYAYAALGADKSVETSAAYIIKETEHNIVSSIWGIYGLAAGDEFTYVNDVTVVFVQGNNMIVTDGTRYILVYGSTGKTYKAGDVIPSGFGGKYALYGGVGQIATPTGFADAKGTAAVPEFTVVETDAAILTNFKEDYMYLSPVQFKDVTIVASGKNYTVKDAKGEFLCYNQYAVTLPAITEGVKYNVKGFASCYGTKNEVMIASIEEAGEPAAVAPVTFSVAAGTYSTAQTVALACATEGATIWYQTTGDWGDAEVYSAPINVNKSMTIYAQAIKGADKSVETSAAYVIEAGKTAANINEVYGLSANDVFTYTNDVTVVFAKGNNTIVTDGTRNLLIYGSTGKTYKAGDIIPAGFGGKYSIYNGVGQIATPFTGFEDAKGTTTIPEFETVTTKSPILTSVDTDNMFLARVEFKGATFTVSNKNITIIDEDGEFAGYNQYGITVPELDPEKTYDIKGFASMFKTTYQVNVCEITENVGVKVVTADNAAAVNAVAGAVEINANGKALIVNAAGQVVANKTVAGNTTIALPAGLYIVKVGNKVAKVVVK